MTKKTHVAVSMSLAAFALLTTSAHASGYIAMPARQQAMPSFSACLALLEAAESVDSAAITPRTVAADGSTREVTHDGELQWDEAAQTAHYRGRLWYTNGRIAQNDPSQREVSHSWREQDLSCAGSTLTTRDAQGYTLSTFEPVTGPEAG